ncbi:MAG: STAS domain-containing protein [Kistimonas sp.]|nr:STAS domain-containing protein [Kistimonas sp.]
MALELTVDMQEDLAIVGLYGNVSSTDAELLNNSFDRLAQANHAGILLDFQDLASINSTGLAALASLVRRSLERCKNDRGKQPVVLCHVNPRIAYLLQLSGLDRFVTIVDSREEGIQLTSQQIALGKEGGML